MPYPSLTYENFLDNLTRAELQQLVALIQGYLSQQHKEDGSHSAVTADSVDVSGDVSVDGTVTADADGSPVTIGATASGPGVDINRTIAGVLSNWRLFADVDNGNPKLALKDVGQVADASLLDIIRTSGGASADYAFLPHSSAIFLKLGANSTGQRWAEVNATAINDITFKATAWGAFNDALSHSFAVTVNSQAGFIKIVSSSGTTMLPFFANGGAGVGWAWTILDPDSGAWQYVSGGGPNTVSFSDGSGTNTYTVSFDGGTGAVSIQRTAGAAPYTASVITLV